MTTEPEQPDPLEQRLHEAGRWCEPRQPGWDNLLARLPQQESSQPPPVRRPRSPWRPLLAAAMLLVVVGAGLYFFSVAPEAPRQALAGNADVEVERRGVQVTVFGALVSSEPTLFSVLNVAAQATSRPRGRNMANGRSGFFRSPEQEIKAASLEQEGPQHGMALVRDQRMVLHLKAGDNVVRFADVAAAIDPTSVTFTSETDPIGTKVVEQNFEFDLASGDALLKRYLDRKITCVGRKDNPDGKAAAGKGDLYEGFLVSYDPGSIILADSAPDAEPSKARPKTQEIPLARLEAIRCDEMPKDLYTRPTLVWKLRANCPGDHLATLSYLCGDVDWKADYVAVVKSDPEKGERLDLLGWVSIDNRSGATYDKARLKLIAGDVNRVRDPWAAEALMKDLSGRSSGLAGMRKESLDEAEKKEFAEKNFFEYKLYTLSQPSTIKDRQIKQLNLLEAKDIPAYRRFVYDPQLASDHAAVELVVQNKKENNLGRALPKGRVTLVAQDPDGESQFLNRDQIDHTAKDEELRLKLGEAFDVIGGYTEVESHQPAPKELIQTSEIRVRNHKDSDIDVRAVAHLQGYSNWEIIEKTDPYTKHDFQTVYFNFRLKANSEKVIRYTVDYRW